MIFLHSVLQFVKYIHFSLNFDFRYAASISYIFLPLFTYWHFVQGIYGNRFFSLHQMLLPYFLHFGPFGRRWFFPFTFVSCFFLDYFDRQFSCDLHFTLCKAFMLSIELIISFMQAFAEWIIFTSSGISSGIYHACDVGTWCALNYNVLQVTALLPLFSL